jgi:four helix bundle protein
MNQRDLKERTKNLAKEIIALCRKLPENREGRLIANQIFRSGTSVAANYRAACRARSRADFVSKMGVVEEEADETIFWLELLAETGISNSADLSSLSKECNEILAIAVSSIRTARKNSK